MLTKLVRDYSVDGYTSQKFDELLNSEINDLIEQKYKIIDIKFASTMSGDSRKTVYCALILYKVDKK